MPGSCLPAIGSNLRPHGDPHVETSSCLKSAVCISSRGQKPRGSRLTRLDSLRRIGVIVIGRRNRRRAGHDLRRESGAERYPFTKEAPSSAMTRLLISANNERAGLFFSNVRQQSHEACPEYSITHGTLIFRTTASLAAREQIAFAINHRPQGLQVFEVHENRTGRLVATVRAEAAPNFLLEALALLAKLLDLGLGQCHLYIGPLVETSRCGKSPFPTLSETQKKIVVRPVQTTRPRKRGIEEYRRSEVKLQPMSACGFAPRDEVALCTEALGFVRA